MRGRQRRQRRPYWRWTKLQLFTHLLVPGTAILLAPLFFDELNASRILGFPLGYFIAVHGVLLVGVLAVLRFVARQDSVDRWHGVHEEI